jgi:hypothetical protein
VTEENWYLLKQCGVSRICQIKAKEVAVLWLVALRRNSVEIKGSKSDKAELGRTCEEGPDQARARKPTEEGEVGITAG